MPKFNAKSIAQLTTCDQQLRDVFTEVIKHWDCTVIEGKRTEAQQKINVGKGVSQTMQSKHVYPLDKPSLAVDVAPSPIIWGDTERFYAFGGFVIGVATVLGIRLRWGGDWDSDRDFKDQKFMDLPHFELVDLGDSGTRLVSIDELEGINSVTGTG